MKKIRQLLQSASTERKHSLPKFLEFSWPVQKANKKLVLLINLLKEKKKGLPQVQNSWQEGCWFVWGEEGEKKWLGKSSPPGAVNIENHFYFSDNCC